MKPAILATNKKEGALRQILYSTLLIVTVAFAGDGTSPRASSSDYPVHQHTPIATIALARVPVDELNRTFPSDLAKKYIVVEVAIYPNGPAVDTAMRDFVLKLGADGVAHPETAEDVAWMWRPKSTSNPELKGNTHVTAESGVIIGSGQDPNTGRRTTGVGTYESVGVSNRPTQPQAPASNTSNADADRMEAKLQRLALQEGKVASPVAGYLYFRVPSKKPKGAMELQYAHEGSSANLKIPTPSK